MSSDLLSNAQPFHYSALEFARRVSASSFSNLPRSIDALQAPLDITAIRLQTSPTLPSHSLPSPSSYRRDPYFVSQSLQLWLRSSPSPQSPQSPQSPRSSRFSQFSQSPQSPQSRRFSQSPQSPQSSQVSYSFSPHSPSHSHSPPLYSPSSYNVREQAIGAHSGSYSIYRALAIALSTLTPTHEPSYAHTEPLVNIPLQPASPPSTSTSTSTRICQLPNASYPPHSRQSLSPSAPLPPPSIRTPNQVGGLPPLVLGDPEGWAKTLQGVGKLPYVTTSLSAALLNVPAFSNNPITKVPLVIVTTTGFTAVVLHAYASLKLYVYESAHHIKRPLVFIVALSAVSIVATLFALLAHSWSQEECSSYCWVERALVSTVVIGGVASLIIGGWRMPGQDRGLVA